MNLFSSVAFAVLHHHAGEPAFSQKLVNRSVEAQLHLWVICGFLLQNLTRAKAVAPDEQRYFLGEARQEQAFFEGAVAAADDDHLLPLVEWPVAGGAEVNSRADEILFAGHIQPAIARSHGEKQRHRAVLIARLGDNGAVAAVRAYFCDRLSRQHLGAESLRVSAHVVGEARALYALRKAEIIINALCYARLTADCAALHNKRLDSLARGIQRS